MANASTVTVTASGTGAQGQAGIPTQTFSNPASPLELLAVTLASGVNSIVVPAGCTFVTVQLPAANAAATTLKGVTGDTGIPLNPNAGFLGFQPTTPGPSTFVLNSASLQTAPSTIGFW